MIAKALNGKSFGGLISYVLEKKKSPEIIGSNGLMLTTKQEITKQFNAVRKLRPQVANVVWHTPISFAHMDKITNQKMRSIALDYLEEMKLKDHQFLIVKHNDTKHSHMHLIINRIGFDGEAARDWKNSFKTMKVMQKLEKKYGLEVALDAGNNRKESIVSAIEFGIAKKEKFSSVMKRVEQLGYNIKINETSNGILRGVSFMDEKKGISYKASDINRSLSKELKQLHQLKEHKNQMSR
jgi:hypothetical protein